MPIRDKENGERLFLQQANEGADLGVGTHTPALGLRCSPAAAKATGPHFSGRLSPNWCDRWLLDGWHLSSPGSHLKPLLPCEAEHVGLLTMFGADPWFQEGPGGPSSLLEAMTVYRRDAGPCHGAELEGVKGPVPKPSSLSPVLCPWVLNLRAESARC